MSDAIRNDDVEGQLDDLRQEEEQREIREAGRILSERIDFGYRIQELLNGPIGIRLEEDSKRDRQRALEDLACCDPDDPNGRLKIRELRLRIYALSTWREFFDFYIADGHAAQEEFVQSGATYT